MNFYVYDLETFYNIFTFTGKFYGQPDVQVFEISYRRNMRNELMSWLSYLQNSNAHMVGFNNLGFDYPIIHELLTNPYTFDERKAHELCIKIISQPRDNRQGFNISLKNRIIPQIDLYKINHFDNENKRTSLKALQFAMRSESVEDLPYDPNEPLNSEQMDELIKYNIHDVTETEKFLGYCMHLIEMRKDLLDSGALTGDVLNYSDVKIGTEYLINKIGRAKCFVRPGVPKQTFRESVAFKDIILPKIQFRTDEFTAILNWFKTQTHYITGNEDNPIHLKAALADVEFHFGSGGVHASVDAKVFHSNDKYVIKDVDVSGMYPSVAIANEFAPEHLGHDFIGPYRNLKSDRKQYKKGTSMNATLKLAGNGAFGNGDNKFSCFYDPRFPKQITINGQLQALQLVELFSLIPGVQIIQANTDGVTIYLPRAMEDLYKIWMKEWEHDTGLELEEVTYKSMWIRDVNNYIAVTTEGRVKRKGAYQYPENWREYDGYWNKDYSAMIVQKVASEMLVNGWNPEALVKLYTDKFDFMMRYKTPAGSKIYIGDKECSKTVRYYVSKSGQPMKKVSQPKGKIGDFKRRNGLTDKEYNTVLASIQPGTWDPRIHTKNKSKYEIVETSIESGWLVKDCNNAANFNWSDIDYDYYLEQIKKLYIGE